MTTLIVVILAQPNGVCSIHEIDPDNPKAIQGLIGGHFEVENLNGGTSLFVDEDGTGKDLEVNLVANAIVRHAGNTTNGLLVGPCVIMGATDDDGNAQSIPSRMVEWLRNSQLTTFPDPADG